MSEAWDWRSPDGLYGIWPQDWPNGSMGMGGIEQESNCSCFKLDQPLFLPTIFGKHCEPLANPEFVR